VCSSDLPKTPKPQNPKTPREILNILFRARKDNLSDFSIGVFSCRGEGDAVVDAWRL